MNTLYFSLLAASLTHCDGISIQETCLASIDAMPFDLLKKKLMARLQTMGVQIIKTYEEVVSQIDTAHRQ